MPPTLLAFDTSASACTVGLLQNEKKYQLHEAIPFQQAHTLLPLIEHLLKEHRSSLSSLDGIVFGKGPGSFTGVRITVSVAQALSFASQLPLIAVSSLAAAAQTAFEKEGWKQIAVAMDARMGEVYWGLYRINSSGLAELLGQEHVSPPEKIALSQSNEADVNNSPWYAVGNGWSAYAGKLPLRPIKTDVNLLPEAASLLTLGEDLYYKKSWIAVEDALPTYLREKVALTPYER